ncbi:MAG: T9SS type A sorting domain-containing protein [Bacteroidetes bacterium]|nr:T9SS type A sorting domain-containing protein [Bacteroidota bacterium]MBS1541801.1 T9SS type A sorting domain-containing protein [Bacteroidota bacterium]
MKNFTTVVLRISIGLALLAWQRVIAQPTVNAPTITAVTTTSATLGGTIAVGTSITHYGTAYKTASGVTQTDNPQDGGATSDGSIPFTFTQNRTGLSAGTLYYWKAWAIGTGGPGLTAEQTFFTEPSQPATFSITTSATTNNQITLAFPAASTLVSGTATGGYVLFRHAGSAPTVSVSDGSAPPANGTGDKIATITSALTSYADGSLSPHTQYYYTLVPFVWDGSTTALYNYNTTSPLSTNGYTLSNPPSGQPTTLAAAGASNSQINLTINWGAVTANGFLIYQNTSGTPVIAGGDFTNGTTPPASLADGSTQIASLSSLATSYNNTGLTAATQYYYIVVPFGYDGSNAATYNYLTTSPKTTNAYTLSNPASGQPTPLNATGTSISQINLTWSSVTATGFLIYRHGGSTIPNVSAIPNGAAPPATLGDGSTLITTAAGGATSYNNTALSAGTQYNYTIVPFGYDGSHAATYNYLIASAPTATGFTFSSPPSGQPAAFSVTATGVSTINLSWPAVTASGYLLYRKTGGSPNLTGLNSGSAAPASLPDGSVLVISVASSPYNDTGLAGSTKYYYMLVPYTWDGTNTGTYNFLTVGAKSANATTFDNTSTITYNSGTATASIPYISYQTVGSPIDNSAPNCVRLGQFKITDVGGDGLPTTLKSVTFSVANSANVSEIAIFDSSGNNWQQYSSVGSSVTFLGPAMSNISVPDGSSDYFEIWATFQGTVTDQQVIQLTITAAAVSVSGSGLASFASTTGASANKIQVAATQLTMTTGSSTANTNTNFGPVTVSAVDALSNVQIGRTDAIALTLLSGVGTLTTAPGGNQNLVNGTISWSSAKIDLAGAKTLKAAKTPTTPNPLTSATTNVTINSAGVTVSPGTLANAPICSSGDYQNISAITITESDPGDFAIGTNVTFSIILPSGFLFNNAAVASLTYAGIPGPATDFTGSPTYSYSGDKTTVTFTYTVATVANKDKITISGLQVNYTGSTLPFSGNMVRLGGTAVQQGNATTDGKVYCALSAAPSASVVSFSVQTIPGQTSVTPTQTRFAVSINSVQLIGTPAGGTFSGPGVSPNATYGYIFSPSSVGVSSGNQIIYSTKETTGQHCTITATKSFDVYASVIQNLQLSYCTNATPSTGLGVLQADIDNQYPPSGTDSYYDLIYYDNSPPCSGLGCSYAGSNIYAGTATITSTYTNNYNLLGTTTLAQQDVFTYTYTWTYYAPGNYFYYAYTSYVYNSNKITNAGSINTFDPSQPYYRDAYPTAVIIYYRAINNSTSVVTIGGGQYVPLMAPPSVTFSLPSRKFCSTDAPVNLVGTPAQNNPVTDKFTIVPPAAGSLPPNSGNTWTFNPSLITQRGSLLSIRYDYTDPATSCSNYDTLMVTVYNLPGQVAAAELNGTGTPSTLITCVGNPAVKFIATAPPGPPTTYNWYSSSVISPANFIQSGKKFTPSTSTATAGSTDYYVTKVLYSSSGFLGCESATATNVRMTVQAGPTLALSSSATQICYGSVVDIRQSTIGAVLTNATTATWSTAGAGQFLDGSNNPSTSLGSSTPSVVKYNPLGSDLPISPGINPTTVILTLTTDNLQAPSCLPATQNFTVTINPAPVAPQFTVPAQASLPGGLFEFCDYDIAANNTLKVAGSGTGTITYYSDNLLTNVLDSGPDPRTYTYNFNPSVSRSVIIYATSTVNNCRSTSASLTFRLNPAPQASFKVSQVCFGAPTQFTDTTHLPTGATTYFKQAWSWGFGDGSQPSAIQNPTHLYKNAAVYPTTLTLTTATTDTNFPCTATSPIEQIEIGPIPQTGFSVMNQCYGDSTVFQYSSGSSFDQTSAGRTIEKWQWDYDFANPGTSVKTQTSPLPPGAIIPSAPKFKYPKPGLYSANLNLISGLGCQNAITLPVYVLPSISFTNSNSFSYSEGFENNNNVLPSNYTTSNNGGWAYQSFAGPPATSWNLQSPAGSVITSASSGSKAWVAGLLPTANNGLNNTYNNREISVLNSPCFDISGLVKPVIAFDYLADTWAKNDGVYLQYSADGGSSWNTFGQKGKGLNWYNDNNIISLASINPNLGQPTGQEGWDAPATATNGWATARYSLSGKQVGATPLRFRFYFGSQANIDPTTKPGDPSQTRLPYNGFGLDSVVIQNANRTVLAEYFTNQTAASQDTPPYNSDTNFLNFESSVNTQSLVKMQYQTSIGGADSINALNPADNQARAAFYGVTGGVTGSTNPFKGFIDGFSDPNTYNGKLMSNTGPTPSAADNYYDARILVTSPLSISLATSTLGTGQKDSLLVDATITIQNLALPINGHQYVVQTAIVKDMSGTGAGPFVMRKMLPNATGKPLTALSANAVQKIHYGFTVAKPYDTTHLYAISFVQDLVAVQPPKAMAGAQNILQAAIQKIKVNALSLITEVTPLTADQVKIYPNPADREFTIALPLAGQEPMQVQLINQLGQYVEAGFVGVGEQTKTISTQGLAEGVYILQLGGTSVRAKIVVLHK